VGLSISANDQLNAPASSPALLAHFVPAKELLKTNINPCGDGING
jgi:hypothetical protein